MARPREFDPQEAVTKAMDVFWQHGYEAASLPELLKGMELTRGSLYKAFVDKKTLFLKVLNRYEALSVDPAVELLTTGPDDGSARINALFAAVLEAVETGDQRGCLLCSAAAGPSAVDPDISQVVQLQLRKMGDAFHVALNQSAALANAPAQDLRDLAGLLLSQYIGLRIMVRSNAPLETIRHSTSAIAKVIG